MWSWQTRRGSDDMPATAEVAKLRERIEARTAVLSVIGLGYVGLAVACEFARVGFRVVGIDINRERVAEINAGRCPIEGDEPGLADLLAEVVAAGRLRASVDYQEA